jgi:hypothetical protein
MSDGRTSRTVGARGWRWVCATVAVVAFTFLVLLIMVIVARGVDESGQPRTADLPTTTTLPFLPR